MAVTDVTHAIWYTGAVLALFLALAAIQFVVSQNLPASSYVTPVGQVKHDQRSAPASASRNSRRKTSQLKTVSCRLLSVSCGDAA
jgi:hypothetical protein